MRHDLTASGAAIRLRPVSDRDASMIVTLRSDAERARFLHPSAGGVGAQLDWLAEYYERPGDYYFVVERLRDSEPEGLIGLYGIAGDEGEFGRWILRRGSLAAPASALLLYGVAFDNLELDRVFARTVADNASVVAFHDRCGARRTGRTVSFDLASGHLSAVEHEVTRAAWPAVRATLEPFAQQAAGLIER